VGNTALSVGQQGDTLGGLGSVTSLLTPQNLIAASAVLLGIVILTRKS
jgi:hypothetical protein